MVEARYGMLKSGLEIIHLLWIMSKKALSIFAAVLLLALIFVAVTDVGGLRNRGLNKAYELTHPDVIGGRCMCCEGTEEYPKDKELGHIGILWDYLQEGGNKIEINGTVYEKDGRSPARDVILYIYHTDQTGRYPQLGSGGGCTGVHGSLRGWAKTDEKGEYKFLTRRPAPYPGESLPAHIHIYVKEPNKNPYYIADCTFDDDPLLTEEWRERDSRRGGDGVLKNGIEQGDVTVYRRDIILGLNIPNYR